jgi:hypothetical protein
MPAVSRHADAQPEPRTCVRNARSAQSSGLFGAFALLIALAVRPPGTIVLDEMGGGEEAAALESRSRAAVPAAAQSPA